MALLGPGCCAGFSLVVESRDYSLLVMCMHLIVVKVKVTQSGPTLCNPMDYTVRGILQARILERGVIAFSIRSFNHWMAKEILPIPIFERMIP